MSDDIKYVADAKIAETSSIVEASSDHFRRAVNEVVF